MVWSSLLVRSRSHTVVVIFAVVVMIVVILAVVVMIVLVGVVSVAVEVVVVVVVVVGAQIRPGEPSNIRALSAAEVSHASPQSVCAKDEAS